MDLIMETVSETPKRETGRPKSKPDHDDLAHIRKLMSTNWRAVQDAQDDDGKFGIGFKGTSDRGNSPTKLKISCRIAKTISDEIESVIEEPRQQKLL
jgi:hypothetical protein